LREFFLILIVTNILCTIMEETSLLIVIAIGVDVGCSRGQYNRTTLLIIAFNSILIWVMLIRNLNFFEEFSNPSNPQVSCSRIYLFQKGFICPSNLALIFSMNISSFSLNKTIPFLSFFIRKQNHTFTSSLWLVWTCLKLIAYMKHNHWKTAVITNSIQSTWVNLSKCFVLKVVYGNWKKEIMEGFSTPLW